MKTHFAVIIDGPAEVQLTNEELAAAVYEKVNAKAEAQEGEKPIFDVKAIDHASPVTDALRDVPRP